MPFEYTNNGMSMRAVEPEWMPAPGAVRFPDYATEAELLDAFPGRQAALDAFALEELRARRNALLAGSDWTQVADSPLSAELQAAWRTYRQALRDLPLHGAADACRILDSVLKAPDAAQAPEAGG